MTRLRSRWGEDHGGRRGRHGPRGTAGDPAPGCRTIRAPAKVASVAAAAPNRARALELQQAIIDPTTTSSRWPSNSAILVIEAEDHPERGLQVAGEQASFPSRVSTVLNLEGLDAENQMRRAAAFLGGLFDVDRVRVGTRCWWWSTRRGCSRRRSPARSRTRRASSLSTR